MGTEAMKNSYAEASRSKIPKILNFKDLDQMRNDLSAFTGRHTQEPEVDPSWTEAETNAHIERMEKHMRLTNFEIALLVNLQPNTPQEAKALIKSLRRFEDADVTEIIHMRVDRMRNPEDKSIAEMYALEHFGTFTVTDNHVGPVIHGGP